jgi:3-isopropylmalate/(R)-2-methylmalate dehydratase large subunit
LPRSGVTAKDISLHIIGEWGADGAAYRSIEFSGDAIQSLSLDERAVIPNMMAEFGAQNAYLPPDDDVFAYLEPKRRREYTPVYPDADAKYDAQYEINVSELSPVIALPHSPDNVVSLQLALGAPVQQAFLGTCTNGRYEDLAAAARVLAGRRVAIRLIVIPASAEVLLKATKTGVLQTLIEAGATIGTPGCGPCMGNHMGIPAPSEATISSANRNFNGRMGTPDAPVYLANPYVVAASAIVGAIADPQEFLE